MSSSVSLLNAQNLFDIKGLVAVVTGGGSGIGSMIARGLAVNGASAVYILGPVISELEAVAKEGVDSNIHPILCDVTSKEQLQHAVDEVTKKSGQVNLLVCNAGKASPVPEPVADEKSTIAEVRRYYFETLQVEDHAAVLKVNTIGVLLTTFAFLELLGAGNKANEAASPPKPKSQIITTASAGAFFRRGSDFIYNGSKAATTHAMKQMATFLVPWDIRSNVIAPGWFLSKITENFAKQFEPTGGVMPKEYVPQQRMGNEEEVAGTILYMASRAGGYLNGSVVLVDGGTLSIHPSSY
ncbi:Short-chain dehydrogenase reductase SAT3 [Hyphodiscus hymeniophilus]|uniref:Short-chain dehydrogenase reductase SAT3 n=1 Tax=Hyphodiscus hymeniophilus TaxID=353542 RepID=A0A9P6VN32_9HELO|nr:Short-chain dehydrogenase reductase SAT3 [Hyphodiscus hymeniophilus]